MSIQSQPSFESQFHYPLGSNPITDFATGKVCLHPVPMPDPKSITVKVSGAECWGCPPGSTATFKPMPRKRFILHRLYLFESSRGVAFAGVTALSPKAITILHGDGGIETLSKSDISRAWVPKQLMIPPPVFRLRIE